MVRITMILPEDLVQRVMAILTKSPDVSFAEFTRAALVHALDMIDKRALKIERCILDAKPRA